MKIKLNFFSIHIIIALTLIITTLLVEIFSFSNLILFIAFIIIFLLTFFIFLFIKKIKIFSFHLLTTSAFFLVMIIYINHIENNYKIIINIFPEINEEIGIIDSYPIIKDNKLEMKIKIIGIKNNDSTIFRKNKPFFLLLNIKEEDQSLFSKGDIVKINKKISLPRKKIFNFDYRKYLFYNEIYGTI